MKRKPGEFAYIPIEHDRYKYRLLGDYITTLPHRHGFNEHGKKLRGFAKGWPIRNDYIDLDCHGRLKIFAPYAWDGPSGPTIDTKNSMRASLVHDALYQLMREGLIPQTMRWAADAVFKEILKADGMGWLRRTYWHLGVKWGARHAAKTGSHPYNYK